MNDDFEFYLRRMWQLVCQYRRFDINRPLIDARGRRDFINWPCLLYFIDGVLYSSGAKATLLEIDDPLCFCDSRSGAMDHSGFSFIIVLFPFCVSRRLVRISFRLYAINRSLGSEPSGEDLIN